MCFPLYLDCLYIRNVFPFLFGSKWKWPRLAPWYTYAGAKSQPMLCKFKNNSRKWRRRILQCVSLFWEGRSPVQGLTLIGNHYKDCTGSCNYISSFGIQYRHARLHGPLSKVNGIWLPRHMLKKWVQAIDLTRLTTPTWTVHQRTGQNFLATNSQRDQHAYPDQAAVYAPFKMHDFPVGCACVYLNCNSDGRVSVSQIQFEST